MKARSQVLAKAAYNGSAPTSAQFPGQRQVHDPWLLALRDAGVGFWRKRGVSVPVGTTVDVADDLGANDGVSGALARGWTPSTDPSGRIGLDGRTTGIELRRARSRRRPTWERREALGRLATTLFHELGHVGGLPHSEKGLMRAGQSQEVPFEALQLIRKMIPRGR